MPDLTLYLGGTRSGKSAQAEADALRDAGPVLYVATAVALPDDAAMRERIRRHRARRPASWRTLECPRDLAGRIPAELAAMTEDGRGGGVTVLVDCAIMWLSNILFSLPDRENGLLLEETAAREVRDLLACMDRTDCRWIVVSGETGLGGIHASPLARGFCDALGTANQLLAARARQVWFCVAGKKLLLQD